MLSATFLGSLPPGKESSQELYTILPLPGDAKSQVRLFQPTGADAGMKHQTLSLPGAHLHLSRAILSPAPEKSLL